jgi:hypothetical protein
MRGILRSKTGLSLTATVAALAAAAGIAACGSSSSPKSIDEIRSCLTEAKVPVGQPTTIGDAKQLQVSLPDGTRAPVEVDASEEDAQSEAKSWKDFGAAAGKTGTYEVNGRVWAGYPGPVPASFKSTIEGCAF